MSRHLVDWDAGKISRFWDHASKHGQADYFSAVYAMELGDEVERIADPDSLVLDLGCGVGDLLIELRRRGFRVCGVDSSSESVDTARRRLPGLSAASLHVGSLTAVPVPDDIADVAVLIEVVEHLLDEDLSAVFCEALRVIRPGGHLLLSTPNAEVLADSHVCCPRCGAVFHRIQHVRQWTSDTITGALAASGFAEIRTYERRLVGDRSLAARARRRVATIRSRSVRCPDCGDEFRRPFRRPTAGTRVKRAAPHLIAIAVKPARSDTKA